MSLRPALLHLFLTSTYHLNLASLTFCAICLPPHIFSSLQLHNVSDQLSFISSYYVSIPSLPCFPHLLCNVFHLTSCHLFNIIMFLTSSPSSLLITSPYHLNLASITFCAICLPPHIFSSLHSIMSLTSSPSSLQLHNVSDQLSFISSYYVSIPSLPCFPHLLCNVFHLTSCHLFNTIMFLTSSPSSLLITSPYHLNLASLTFCAICLPPHIFSSLHSIMSLTSSPSSLLITYPYHLCLASLTFSAMSSTLRLRISSTPSCF